MENQAVKELYGGLYEDIKIEGYAKWNTIIFLSLRALAIISLVALYFSSFWQSISYYIINLFAFLWALIIRPHLKIIFTISEIMNTFCCLIANGIYMKLIQDGLSDEEVEKYGDSIMYFSSSCYTYINIQHQSDSI